MDSQSLPPPRHVTWKEEIWRQMAEIEDLVDRVALRLGDALFSRKTTERLFGPHPAPF